MTPDQKPETTGVDLDELADAACKRALPLTWEAEESADERGHGGECIYNAFEVCSSFRDGYKARAAEDEVELRTLRARVGELEAGGHALLAELNRSETKNARQAAMISANLDRITTLESQLEAARSKAEQYERDWYAAKSEFGTARAKDAARMRELESQLEAARETEQLEAKVREVLSERYSTLWLEHSGEWSDWSARWLSQSVSGIKRRAATLPALLRAILEVEAKGG